MRHLTNWRLWFAIGFVGLVAVATFYVLDSIETRNDAIVLAEETVAAQIDQRQAATQRIDGLTGRIDDLTSQLQKANRAVNRLEGQVSDLREQVINLGGEPVVVTETERVVVEENSGQTEDQTDGSFTTQSEPEDTCENRNPQGKCTDPDPKGK